ncbi:hypothetical protein CYLTODRAFT_486495 [Cylindrobasidium torrendii FP15055 ss-10]|uniref:Uncharacterized protein n=1 Tax=Cylindrobasidium torrendii FP15055 ss-10 TaxID=1314674 RepID=A0A0D7BP14_9AGAR|nr:hypothetical protein CYLTODRAFT_486495 [Cylindrobasidium torrendii FP15055 ss-10]
MSPRTSINCPSSWALDLLGELRDASSVSNPSPTQHLAGLYNQTALCIADIQLLLYRVSRIDPKGCAAFLTAMHAAMLVLEKAMEGALAWTIPELTSAAQTFLPVDDPNHELPDARTPFDASICLSRWIAVEAAVTSVSTVFNKHRDAVTRLMESPSGITQFSRWASSYIWSGMEFAPTLSENFLTVCQRLDALPPHLGSFQSFLGHARATNGMKPDPNMERELREVCDSLYACIRMLRWLQCWELNLVRDEPDPIHLLTELNGELIFL